MANIKIIKAFISYKWEDDKHNRWVEQLATDLRRLGIDALLDKWEVRYGDSFTDYMTASIHTADVFLFVMTPLAVDAVETSGGKAGAVHFEVQLATARKIAGERFRFIGVLRRGNKIVRHLKDCRYVDFRKESRYKQSLRSLADDLLGSTGKPPLGDPQLDIASPFHEICRIDTKLPKFYVGARFIRGSKNLIAWSSDSDTIGLLREYRATDTGWGADELDCPCRANYVSTARMGWVIAATEQGGVRAVSLQTRSTVATLPMEVIGEPMIRSINVHEEQPWVAVGTDYGSIVMWDYEGNNVLWRKRFFPREEIVWINHLAFNSLSNQLLFTTEEHGAFSVDDKNGETIHEVELRGRRWKQCMSFCAAKGLLAVGEVTSLSIYQLKEKPSFLYNLHLPVPYADNVEFDRLGEYMAIQARDDLSEALVAEVEKGRVIFTTEGLERRDSITSISISDDARMVAYCSGGNVVIMERSD